MKYEIWRQKTRIVGLSESEEIMTWWFHDFMIMKSWSFLRFDTIPARDRRTDGQADRRTDTLLSQRPAQYTITVTQLYITDGSEFQLYVIFNTINIIMSVTPAYSRTVWHARQVVRAPIFHCP